MKCPFALHGCTAVLPRMDYDRHQIDSAFKHAELLATELNRLRDAATSINTSVAYLLNQEQIIVNWKVDDVFKRIESGEELNSEYFKLSHQHGDSFLFMNCGFFRSGLLDGFVYKDSDQSTHKASMDVTGTTITLKHPTDPTLNITHTCNEGMIEEPLWNEGWDPIVADVKPYIYPDGSISLVLKLIYRMGSAEITITSEEDD